MSDLPQFGTVGFYEVVAENMNNDPTWLEMATPITYTMVFSYGEPISKDFFIRFDEGRITEVYELEDPASVTVDFFISGKPEHWQGVIQGTLNPNSAMATGKLKVDGKQTVLLRHMKKFAYMINMMTQIEASYT
jgi:putative sterol carrier protein